MVHDMAGPLSKAGPASSRVTSSSPQATMQRKQSDMRAIVGEKFISAE